MPGLFDPLEIKGLRLKNRIVMPPMANNQATEEGLVTSELIAHYVERAEGGVALVMVEHSYVVPAGRFNRRQLAITSDAALPGLRELVERVHAAGAAIGLQITHAGSATTTEEAGVQPEAPSPVLHPTVGKEIPRELTREDLDRIRAAFAEAARRVRAAGFDLVEIHGAHGYLLNQFYSPLTNRRTDEYGGTRENRLRFPLEVVAAVRQAVGPDYPVFYRFGASDRLPDGLTVEDGRFAAPRLVEAGVDVLDISGGLCGSRPAGAPPGYFVPLAEAIKPVVSVPVLVTGGITEPELADRIIREGKADLVGIGRALLADPRWPEKAREALLGQRTG